MARLTLTLRQPARFGGRSKGINVLETEKYLPGSVVRGAFASAWVLRNGRPSGPECTGSGREEFIRLFEGGIRFAPLFAGPPFFPLSVVTHKPGGGEGCPWRDVDLTDLRAEPTHRTAVERIRERGCCPACQEPLVQLKELLGVPPLHRRTSVAIHEEGVARRAQLYTRETFSPRVSFVGNISGPPDLLAVLRDLGEIRVGGRRTTHGLGTVRIEDAAVAGTPERYGSDRIVLRLASPGVFVDRTGRPVRDPDPDELREVLGAEVRVERRWTRWTETCGWHMASGLPKPAELAVAPGSTYVLRCDPRPEDAALLRLAERGIGLRRHEGFGDLAPPPPLRPGREWIVRRYAAVTTLSRYRWWTTLVERLTDHAEGRRTARELRETIRGMPGGLERDMLLEVLDLPREHFTILLDSWRTP